MKNLLSFFLLFKNVLNMDQYVSGLVLGSNIFLLPLNTIYFSNWQAMNLVDSEMSKTLQKKDSFCYF